jgi:BlaI family transcriptional regulator, penicillinase repressor
MTTDLKVPRKADALDAPGISDAEAVVMDALWREHPLSAERVVAAVAAQRQWAEPTVKTLLNRLLKKGAITAELDGRRYLYAPAIERERWLARQARSMLESLFGGRVAPLVAHLGERGELSADDLQDIKALIARMEREGRKEHPTKQRHKP